MVKRMLAVAAVLAFAATPLAAQARGQGAAQADSITLTGQVVDVSCYSTNGASGPGHVACAKACAEKGIALAILAEGTIYVPVSSGMADPQNPRLIPFAEQRVRVSGLHRLKNGLHTIEIRSIAAAS